VVETGAVEIAIGKGEERKVLGTIGNGGMFGEMALIDDAPRMAEAVAIKDTTCLIVAKDKFREKLGRADPFIKGLLRILVRNVRAATRDG
jgi:CRP/FNR family transcriptional regulator, cyclic AMP receptor protein